MVVAEGASDAVDQVLRHRHVARHRLLRHRGAAEFVRIHHDSGLRRDHVVLLLLGRLLRRLRTIALGRSLRVCSRADARVARAPPAPTSGYLPAGDSVSVGGAPTRARLVLSLGGGAGVGPAF